eukprot:GDKJ01046719.1.p1 GENE.GDKJ01046719.1~~GDKJ01046719.1.p1  ORF type:complete len:790 (-),score=129.93 GDKJ01046719.1:75-2444(-)
MSISDPTKCVENILIYNKKNILSRSNTPSKSTKSLDSFLLSQYGPTGTDDRRGIGILKDIHDRIPRKNLKQLNGNPQPHCYLSPLYNNEQLSAYNSIIHHSLTSVASPSPLRGIPLPKGLSKSATERVLKLSTHLLSNNRMEADKGVLSSSAPLSTAEISTFINSKNYESVDIDEDLVECTDEFSDNKVLPVVKKVMRAASTLFNRDDLLPPSPHSAESNFMQNRQVQNEHEHSLKWSSTRLGMSESLMSVNTRGGDNQTWLKNNHQGSRVFNPVIASNYHRNGSVQSNGGNYELSPEIDTCNYLTSFARVGNSRPSPCFTSVSRQVPAAYAPLGTSDEQIPLADGMEADLRKFSFKIDVVPAEGAVDAGMATEKQAELMKSLDQAIRNDQLQGPMSRRWECTQMKQAIEETGHLMDMTRIVGRRQKAFHVNFKKGIVGIDGPHLEGTTLYKEAREKMLSKKHNEELKVAARQNELWREGAILEGQLGATQVKTETLSQTPFAGKSLRGGHVIAAPCKNSEVALKRMTGGCVSELLDQSGDGLGMKNHYQADGTGYRPAKCAEGVTLIRSDDLGARGKGWTSRKVENPSNTVSSDNDIAAFRYLNTKDRLFPKHGFSWNVQRAEKNWHRDQGAFNGTGSKLPDGKVRGYDIVNHGDRSECPSLKSLPPNRDFMFDPFQPVAAAQSRADESHMRVNTDQAKSSVLKYNDSAFLNPRGASSQTLQASRSMPSFGTRLGVNLKDHSLNLKDSQPLSTNNFQNGGRVQIHHATAGGYLPVNTALESLRAQGKI